MQPLELPVGVRHKPTKASSSTSWREANLMRWVGGQLQPIAGWERVDYTTPASPIRKIHVWVTLTGIRMTAFVCETNVYVDQGDGILVEITPVDGISPPFDPVFGGYGDNLYSLDTYGTPRPERDTQRVLTPCYSVDNWGEDLLVMTSPDGRLLRWKPSAPTSKLTLVPGSPLGRCFVVTPQRFVIIFGVGTQHNRFQWCDQENVEEWTLSVTSKAGGFNVEPASPLITAIVVGNEIFFASTTNLYIIRFIGLPYVYQYVEIGSGATPISSASIAEIPDGCMWVSESGVWTYNGATVTQVPCDIWEWFTDNYDTIATRRESFMVDITIVSEIWWFFASAGSTINNRVMICNYREGWWSMGRLTRTAGFSSSYVDLPIMANSTMVHFHEKGQFYGMAELPWIESYSLNIDSGDRMMTLSQMLPDLEGDPSGLAFTFYMRDQRAKGPETVSEIKTVRDDGYLDIRETARDFRMRIQSTGVPVSLWTMGQTLYEAIPRGDR